MAGNEKEYQMYGDVTAPSGSSISTNDLYNKLLITLQTGPFKKDGYRVVDLPLIGLKRQQQIFKGKEQVATIDAVKSPFGVVDRLRILTADPAIMAFMDGYKLSQTRIDPRIEKMLKI